MPFEGDVTDAWPSCPPRRVPDRHRLAGSSPSTFTTVEVGATVRQFTGTELAPESAYIFRLPAKTRQGWASRWRPPSSPLRREVRPEAQVHCRGATGEESWAGNGAGNLQGPRLPGQALYRRVSTQPDVYQPGRNVPGLMLETGLREVVSLAQGGSESPCWRAAP